VSEPLTAEALLRDFLDNYEFGDAVDAKIRATLDAARDRPGLAALDLNSERGTSVATEHPLSERLAQQREGAG
jgi:hypothetical protein